ncbi:cytochrome P450 [Chytriomyces sp. MP71]|nr:cytochrome P450 [Chytriomyces sp. MP71]
MTTAPVKSRRNFFLPAVATVTAVAGILTYWYWDDAIGMTPKPDKRHKHLPRIGGHVPFLGDALTVGARLDDIHDFMTEIMERNGNQTTIMKAPLSPLYFLTNNPQIVECILKTHFDDFEKGPVFHANLEDFLGNGIFNVDGELWKSQRKNAANIFNVKNFKDFVNDVFSAQEEKLTVYIESRCLANETFDLCDMFFRLTFDAFMQIGFGFQTDSVVSTNEVEIMRAFDDIQHRIAPRFSKPFWRVEEYLSGEAAIQKKQLTLIRDFGLKIIQEKRRRGVQEHDLLALLMNVTDENENLPTNNVLIDYVLNFLLAGRDTTAGTLSWTFFMLHKHPNVVSKLRDEIATVLNDATPTYGQIKSDLPYATAVLRESLRLYPAVPGNVKQAVSDVTLPDGTFVPKGSFVGWNPYVLGRTEDIWGLDVKQFRPERWLEMEKQPSPFDYPVFHAGPRVCLGKQMAELEIVYVMVELVRKFDFEVVDEASVKYAYSLTLQMKNGMKVRCKKRT